MKLEVDKFWGTGIYSDKQKISHIPLKTNARDERQPSAPLRKRT